MATKTYIGNNFDTLRAVLEASGLFASVTKTSPENVDTVTCTNADDETVLTIAYTASNTWTFTVPISGSDTFSRELTTNGANYGYRCANGVLFSFGTSSSGFGGKFTALITKNNHDAVSVVLPSGSSSLSIRNTVYCLTKTDVSPVSSYSITSTEKSQTVLSPFITNAAEGDTSYTPNAFYMQFGQYAGINLVVKFVMNGKMYLTDGYFVLSDGEVVTS